MPLLLSIETSTKVCSVALHRGKTLLASSEIVIEKSHSKFITILIENLFQNDKISLTYSLYDRMIIGGVKPISDSIILPTYSEILTKAVLQNFLKAMILTGMT